MLPASRWGSASRRPALRGRAASRTQPGSPPPTPTRELDLLASDLHTEARARLGSSSPHLLAIAAAVPPPARRGLANERWPCSSQRRMPVDSPKVLRPRFSVRDSPFAILRSRMTEWELSL